jgi:hypothetical protein
MWEVPGTPLNSPRNPPQALPSPYAAQASARALLGRPASRTFCAAAARASAASDRHIVSGLCPSGRPQSAGGSPGSTGTPGRSRIVITL